MLQVVQMAQIGMQCKDRRLKGTNNAQTLQLEEPLYRFVSLATSYDLYFSIIGHFDAIKSFDYSAAGCLSNSLYGRKSGAGLAEIVYARCILTWGS